MRLRDFHSLRSGVQSNAWPASERTLVFKESMLRTLLVDSGLFDNVEVEYTDDPDQLLAVLCELRPGVPEHEVVAAVETMWEAALRFPAWEAHAVMVDDGFVELEAATRDGSLGEYLTLHLVAQRTGVPSGAEAVGTLPE